MDFGTKTRKRYRTAIAVLPALALSFAAWAADIGAPVYKARAPAAAYDWTGLYAGINAGSAFNTSNFLSHSATIKSRGALAGATFGYNRQNGWVVLGVEGDINWSDTHGSVTCGSFVCETRNPWFGTVRGRFGGAFNRWLPYITAGAAFGEVKTTSSDPANTGGSRTRAGWSAGVGVEYAFAPRWSAKIEYLYVCLGDIDQHAICRTSVTPANISVKESVIRAGINYKFSGPLF
jgi:outer membrane immunogenic protein